MGEQLELFGEVPETDVVLTDAVRLLKYLYEDKIFMDLMPLVLAEQNEKKKWKKSKMK